MTQRIVSFANCAINIQYDDARAAAIVDYVFRDAPGDIGVTPHMTFRIVSGDAPPRWGLDRDGALQFETNSDAALAEYLMGEVCHHLTDASRGGLVFHAAALAYAGQGVLVPGGIGAGKTTLTAWLVPQGLDYLTDEMVFVPQGAEVLHAFTRPLNVKKPSRPALHGIVDFEKNANRILSSDSADLVPPTVLRPANALCTPRPRLILFPRYQPEAKGQIEPLTKAQAGLALMQCLVNARNLPEQGFPETARVARLAPAYRLTYSHFDQIAKPVQALLQKLRDKF